MSNKRISQVVILATLFVLFSGSLFSLLAQENNEQQEGTTFHADAPHLVYVIPIHQTIESGLQQFLERAVEEANAAHADHIVFEVNTLGGGVEEAMNIGELIRSIEAPTTAYVKGKAISAGSYISLNADQIVMEEGSSIGSAAVVTIDGQRVEDSKTISAWISLMTAAAERNGRNPEYAAGMVDDRLVITVEELDRTYDEGELLSFTHAEALAAGYAEANAESMSDVLTFIHAEQAEIVRMETTVAENIARFLTDPIIMTVLLLAGIAGVGIELFVPGFGLPGIIGIVAFAAYFGGHYVAGFAGIEHMLLFIAGIVLLAIEIFSPSFGIFAILGIISLFSGVVLAAYDTGNAMTSLGIAFIVSIVLIVVVAKIFQKRGVWNKFILKDQFKTEEGYISNSDKTALVGKTGKSVTPLRPSGVALIDDERVDVVTSGEFIAAGKEIIVYKTEGTRVVVKEHSNEDM